MQKATYIYLAIGVLLVAGVVSAWTLAQPEAQETKNFEIALAEGDEIADWNFKGAYVGNAELKQRAEAEITRLEGLFGKEEFSDYILYVSIANQYDLLGDGANELEYLKRALAEDSTNTGLAWHNAGVLFSRLGAKRTAKNAFESAITVQPLPQYEASLKDFLEHNPELGS